MQYDLLILWIILFFWQFPMMIHSFLLLLINPNSFSYILFILKFLNSGCLVCIWINHDLFIYYVAPPNPSLFLFVCQYTSFFDTRILNKKNINKQFFKQLPYINELPGFKTISEATPYIHLENLPALDPCYGCFLFIEWFCCLLSIKVM